MSNSFGQGGQRPGQRKFKKQLPPYDPSNPPTPEQRAKYVQHIRNSMLYYLGRGDRTRRELEMRMARKRHIPPEVITEVLDEFQKVGYIDDARVAEAFVYSATKYRSLGKQGVANELRRKGVDAEIIQEAIADIDPEVEEEQARELVRRRMVHNQRVEPMKRTNQLVGLLARKGYSPSIAFRIVKEELADEAVDVDEEIDFGE